eukprot:13606355-Alexandrium_andersonii.AAC.1
MAFHKRVEQLLTPRKGVLQLSSRVCRYTLGERSVSGAQVPRAMWEVQESALDPGWASFQSREGGVPATALEPVAFG